MSDKQRAISMFNWAGKKDWLTHISEIHAFRKSEERSICGKLVNDVPSFEPDEVDKKWETRQICGACKPMAIIESYNLRLKEEYPEFYNQLQAFYALGVETEFLEKPWQIQAISTMNFDYVRNIMINQSKKQLEGDKNDR